MNIIIAVVLDGFVAVQDMDSLHPFVKQVEHLRNLWMKADPTFGGLVHIQQVVNMLMIVRPPLGYHGSRERSILISLKDLPLYAGHKIHLRDLAVLGAQRCHVWISGGFEEDARKVRIDPEVMSTWTQSFPDNEGFDFTVAHFLIARRLSAMLHEKTRKRKERAMAVVSADEMFTIEEENMMYKLRKEAADLWRTTPNIKEGLLSPLPWPPLLPRPSPLALEPYIKTQKEMVEEERKRFTGMFEAHKGPRRTSSVMDIQPGMFSPT
jgi:hypothetical protein